jgi:hypothetical protein
MKSLKYAKPESKNKIPEQKDKKSKRNIFKVYIYIDRYR